MISIQPMAEEDHREIRTLEMLCIREYVELTIKKRWEDLDERLRGELGASAEGSYKFYYSTGLSFVAKEEGKIVGFIFAQMIPYINGAPLSVWIENIGVHPEHRRKGVAYQLLRRVALEGKKKGAKVVHSSISIENVRSIMLHKKLGFLMDTRKIAILDLSSNHS